jgi:predicted RNA binding protein with dsRBD fold (UPF0201 family)
VDEIARALRAAEGIISNAAQRLGVTRQAVHARISRHPTLQAVRDEARESVTDLAESMLIENIRRGEAWAVCFYLKTQGRDRGYVERTEEHRAVSGDIRVTIRTVDDRRDPSLD